MATRRKMVHLGGWFWWAGDGFLRPGLYMGAFRENIRLLPAFWKKTDDNLNKGGKAGQA